MKVIALQRGYDNVAVREEGEEFDMPKGAKGTWFKPVEQKPARRGAADADDGKADDTGASSLA